MVFACIMYGQQLTPHWTTPLNFLSSMSINSLVYIDGVEPNSEYLELGAFCNGDCRGSALPAGMVAGHMLYMLPVNGEVNGDVITFRLYDHQLGQELEYDCTDTIIFAAEAILGAYPDFYPLHFISPVQVQTQVVNLAVGANWFSSNVEITLADLQNTLTDVLGTNASITISSQTQSCTIKRNKWTGTLETIDLSQMYMIEVETACEISLEGEPINPANHPVTISFGENWIAFPLNVTMSLNDAFAGFAQNDDAISSQTANASVKRNKWTGTMSDLQPGQGYIYNSASSETRTFTFPASK